MHLMRQKLLARTLGAVSSPCCAGIKWLLVPNFPNFGSKSPMLPRSNTDKLSNVQSTKLSRHWITAGSDFCFQLWLQRKWSAWSGRCTTTMIFLQDCTLFPLAMSQLRRQSSRVMRIISATWRRLRSWIHRWYYPPTATSTFRS